ncbi:hypothetical protein LTR84_006344 [Exophiala bonariae]|uniref:Major facilitator superfamily (MFS) profile domain-containing protein n=1 Tax=Exophiala bonariae TaxID=1690606 RepID=A0AAV9N4F0_9EURO|nr:hypothetical protein LTR84_006344 [Exophiala bonariae]
MANSPVEQKGSTKAIETIGHDTIENEHFQHPAPMTVTEDPFTWPFWIKIGITLNICVNAFLNNVSAAGLVPTLSPISAQLGIPITVAANLMAYNVLAQGLGNMIWVPTMLSFGKRWTVLGTMLLLLPCIAWGATAKSYESLLAARIMSGFASGASESFAPVIIGDIWYEHSLTTALGFFVLCILAGAGLGQLVLGYVTQGAGWRWAFWVTFIACGVNFLTMLLWLPETTYQRGLTVGTTAGDVERSQMVKEGKTGNDETIIDRGQDGVNLAIVATAPQLRSFSQNLWFFRHPHVQYRQNWFLSFIRPFHFFISVPVTWSSLTYAVAAGAFTALGVCVPQLTAGPPYNFGPGAQGLFGVSSLVGGILGGTVGSKLVDIYNSRMEKRRFRRHQEHKPEERLVMIIIPFVTVSTGLVMYGFTIERQLPWIAPAVGYVMHSFGFAVLAGITYSYAVDAYLLRSGEVMVFNNTIRALLSFGFANFMPSYMVKVGPATAYSVLAGVVWGMSALALPMFFFGPKLRAMTNRLL